MKSLVLCGAAAIGVLSVSVVSSQAALLQVEEFIYNPGSITGLNGGSGFTGPYTGSGNVTSPGLLYAGLLTAGNKFTTASNNAGAFRTITPVNTNSGVIWISFLESTTGTVANYAGLSFFSGGTEELFLGKPSNTTNYGFATSGVPGGDFNSALAPATTSPSFLLYRVTFSAAGETVDFFANNVPGTAPTTPTGTFAVPEGSFATNFDNIRLQSGDQAANFDEIRIGTTYADVAPVPEPSALALVGVGALALVRRRRR